MAIWAIADLHLSFGVPNKNMDVFGPQWAGYTDKIEKEWRSSISPDDLVLIPGIFPGPCTLKRQSPIWNGSAVFPELKC